MSLKHNPLQCVKPATLYSVKTMNLSKNKSREASKLNLVYSQSNFNNKK